MPRRRRDDQPGACFHTGNRTVAGRRLFRSVGDARRFLSRVAHVVREGLLELHAYALAPSSYQLVVRSPEGRLSDAMRRIQEPYARSRNVEAGTSGPLFAGRFRAKRLSTVTHQAAALAHVHAEPALASLAGRAEAWPFTSAALAAGGRAPRWLVPLSVPASSASLALVERWLASPSPEPADLDDLLEASPLALTVWLRHRAASGSPVVVLVGEAALDRAHVASAAETILAPGLLRTVGGLKIAEVASRFGIAPSTAHARVRAHLARLAAEPRYGALAARALHDALRNEYGCRGTPIASGSSLG